MSTDTLDELGPVDYLVVEFPADQQNFNGEMAAELLALIDSGTIRVLDVLLLQKDADGNVDALEVDDLDEADELRRLEEHVAELLAEEDVVHLAAAMEPGTIGAVLVWENTWAAGFASAARRAGGQLVANGRIPVQALLAALADETLTEGV
jgi:hypothetical protein